MSDDAEDHQNYPTMPTVWKGKDGAAIRSNNPLVHPDEMSAAERNMLTTTYNTCGMCVYFEKSEGQAQIKSQRFVERLVREEDWQVKHLASPVNELGFCGAHSSGNGGDQVLTGVMHKSCDQFRMNRGLVSLRRKTTD